MVRSATDNQNNVGDIERVASVTIGAALVANGLRERDGIGMAGLLAGAALMLRGATGRCPVYHALGVNGPGTSPRLNAGAKRSDVTGASATVNARKARKVERTVTIQRERADLYNFWHDFTQLPQFMEHLVSVSVIGGGRTHWVAKGPAGQTVEWDAEIVNDEPNALIAWKSVGDATVPNAGSVHFADAAGGRGTTVKVTMDYEPPGGFIGAGIAALFGENPDRQVREDLRKFKQLMETGAVTTAARLTSDDAVRSFASQGASR